MPEANFGCLVSQAGPRPSWKNSWFTCMPPASASHQAARSQHTPRVSRESSDTAEGGARGASLGIASAAGRTAQGTRLAKINAGLRRSLLLCAGGLSRLSPAPSPRGQCGCGLIQERRSTRGRGTDWHGLLYCSGHLVLFKIHLHRAAPLLTRDQKALLNLA